MTLMIVILLIYEACNEMRRGKITHRGESVNGSYNKGIIISLLIASHSIISHSYFSLLLLLGF